MGSRETILEQSLHLFSRRGYQAVGVQEICSESGITKPTLYHHFGSKLGLLQALLEEQCTPLIALIVRHSHYQHDLTRNLNELTIALFRFATDNQAFYRLYLALSFAPGESEAHQAFLSYGRRMFELLSGMFEQAEQDHGNMRGRHRRYGVSFLGMVHGYIGLLLNGTLELSDGLARDAVHQFMHGIFS